MYVFQTFVLAIRGYTRLNELPVSLQLDVILSYRVRHVPMHTVAASIAFMQLVYVTVSAKTVLNGTFSITRKTDLKYSSCCSSVVLDFSHARLTV